MPRIRSGSNPAPILPGGAATGGGGRREEREEGGGRMTDRATEARSVDKLYPAEVRMMTQRCGSLVYPAGSAGAAFVDRAARAVVLINGNGKERD